LGSSSHKVTNVYVYFNNAPVGVFDLPVTFPVMATGPGTLTVLPGIDFDGLRGYQVNYPLYSGDTLAMVPQPGATINYTPVTGYHSQVELRISDDFDQGAGPFNTFKKLSGDAELVNTRASGDVFEGNGSGVIHLGPGKDSATVISSSGKFIPAGKASYIELDYRGNMPLQVGMVANLIDGSTKAEYFIGLRPRQDWGKIYIGIREFVSTWQGPEYRILLRAQKPPGVTDGYVYIDNIKVVNFK
jgi:hypothetical protein